MRKSKRMQRPSGSVGERSGAKSGHWPLRRGLPWGALGGSKKLQKRRAGGKFWHYLASMPREGPDLENEPWILVPCRQLARKAGMKVILVTSFVDRCLCYEDSTERCPRGPCGKNASGTHANYPSPSTWGYLNSHNSNSSWGKMEGYPKLIEVVPITTAKRGAQAPD